jgi:hypothetical protein
METRHRASFGESGHLNDQASQMLIPHNTPFQAGIYWLLYMCACVLANFEWSKHIIEICRKPVVIVVYEHCRLSKIGPHGLGIGDYIL